MTRVFFAGLASVLLVVLANGGAAADKAPSDSAAYTVIDDSGGQLRSDFNRAKGSVRLLFVVDPVCPTCAHGLSELDHALLAGTRDPRLQVFVVYAPVIGGTAADIHHAAALLHNPQVHNYWNAAGGFPRRLGTAVGFKRDNQVVEAWDVWLLYGPDAEWGDAGPTAPQVLMHQLDPVQNPDYKYLDGKRFAQDVRAQLAALPAH